MRARVLGTRVLGIGAAVVLLVAALTIWAVTRPSADEATFHSPTSVGSLADQVGATVPAALHRAHVPGAAIAIVHQGKVAWSGGFGVTRAGGHDPIGADTVFQVGSLSKEVTAWGAMNLSDSGELPVDMPLTEVLHPWPLPASRFAATGITPRRVLSHTAGLSVEGYLGTTPGTRLPSTLDSLRGVPDPATAVTLTAAPGTRYQYSGGGYTLLQAAIEQRTGQPFAAWAQTAVLQPLGMSSSAYSWPPRRQPSVAVGHDRHGVPVPGYRYTELAAAGLASTAADLGRFLVALLRDPGRLGTPQPKTGGRYGFGVEIKPLADGVQSLQHEGVNRGWYARVLAFPNRNWAVVILTNGDGGGAVANAVQNLLVR